MATNTYMYKLSNYILCFEIIVEHSYIPYQIYVVSH